MSFKSDLMAVLDDKYAQAVIDHRKAKRAPLTEHAARVFLKSLSTCADKYAAIDMMIERNWTTIKQEWIDNATRNTNGNGGTDIRDWKKAKRDEAIKQFGRNIGCNEEQDSSSSPVHSLPRLLAPEE